MPLVIPLSASVPAARILMLAGISFATMVVESTRGAAVPLAILLLLQAMLAMAALWIVAYGVSRLMAHVASGTRTAVTVAVVVVLVAVTTVGSFYRDPYRPESLHANLIQVYE